jgi:uncharacterized cupin superfamily protein
MSANLFDPEFDDTSERDGFRGRRARLGRQAGAEHLGASLFELEPGCAAFPLHYHLGNEEMLVVVSGEAALRTFDGERRLVRPESGKVSAFGRPPGAAGEGFHDVYYRRDTAEFWEDETPPPPER